MTIALTFFVALAGSAARSADAPIPVEGALPIEDSAENGDAPASDVPADHDDGAARPEEATEAVDTAPVDHTAESGDPEPAEDVPEDDDGSPGFIDAGHAYTSAGVRGLASWLDGFFANENYEAEVNESRLRLRIDSFVEEYEGVDVDAKARLYLKLPALDERLRLEVLSAGEADEDTLADTAPPASEPLDQGLDSLTAALSYFLRNDPKRSISLRVGLDFDGYDPNPFLGARYRAQVGLNEFWNFRFVQRFRYYSLDGLESRTLLGLDRALPAEMLFRWEINGVWLEEDPNYFYGVNFSLFQPLSKKTALEYQILNSFRTDPHRLDETTLRLRYRRQIWRDWLFLEAAPQLAMRRARDYEPVPGILFRLEMIFGG
ncbi:MAG: hypothetical protein JSU82_04265 [Rhodospirillales bacterium]|nr:MAG: hypothetical protein JSU82_04265 [Rhodospirillales bacterium]